VSAQTSDENDCKNHELLAATDPARALAACLRLAEQNNAAAEASIGQMYERGHGVQQSDTIAAFWYRKAADQGLATAESSLGRIFYRGIVTPDFVTAAEWFRKAADQGDVEAQIYLGTMYSRGQGLPMDYVQAYKWYDLSASVKDRDRVAANMTPAQVAEAQKLAAAWKPTTGQ
jgi:TPR repeat protein